MWVMLVSAFMMAFIKCITVPATIAVGTVNVADMLLQFLFAEYSRAKYQNQNK